jgi:Lar family restriction alleviation protein
MTNAERFKTAKEREEGFYDFCDGKNCKECALKDVRNNGTAISCPFYWLELQHKKELKSCPFCGGKAKVGSRVGCGVDYYFVECTGCFAKTVSKLQRDEAVDDWNRRAE